MSSIPSTNAFYRLVSLCLYSAITVAVPAQAQNFGLPFAEPETMGVSPTSLQQITEMLQRHVDDGLIAGAVAGVARNGKTVYLQAIGSQHIENDVPMRTDSIFQVRSMSKPITALAALQLVEQGRLGLQDPVSDHIPQFGNMFVYINADEPFISAQRRPERDMTIEHLLLNTAGLSHRNGVLYREHQVRSRADTLEQLARKVARVPLIGDPGEQWVYSISMTILGRVVEVVSGQALDDYLDDEVYGPLGMDDTAFYVPPEKAERLARVYQVGEESSLSLVPDMEIPITEEPPLL
ncbi:MAG: serine hydrolase domain-containing protein, partial [Pseudohongiellaceae bacterium]